MDRGAWWAAVHRVRYKESDTTWRLNNNKLSRCITICPFVLCSVSRPSCAVLCMLLQWNPWVSIGRCVQGTGEGGGQSSGSASSLWTALLKEVVALWRVLALGRWCPQSVGFRNTPSKLSGWQSLHSLIAPRYLGLDFPYWPGQHLFSGLDPHWHTMLICNSFSFRKQNRKLFCSSKV